MLESDFISVRYGIKLSYDIFIGTNGANILLLAIKSICPKCNTEGTQHIYRNRQGGRHQYLEYVHKTGDLSNSIRRCYIGRIKSTEEAMGEFTKPETFEEYKDTLKNIVNDLQDLVDKCNTYSTKSRVPVTLISSKLNEIIHRYGY
jgi:hypothetical protein